MTNMPIDPAAVDWAYVAVLAVLAFISTLIGSLLSFRRIFLGAVLSTLLFAVGYVFWTYYPQPVKFLTFLPRTPVAQKTPAATAAPPTAPAAPAVPQKPANPVTDITPPKNPVTTISPPPPSPQQPAGAH